MRGREKEGKDGGVLPAGERKREGRRRKRKKKCRKMKGKEDS